MKATYIMQVTVIDPDTQGRVTINIYKEEAGGMFGIDNSFENTIISPFGNGEITEIDG